MSAAIARTAAPAGNAAVVARRLGQQLIAEGKLSAPMLDDLLRRRTGPEPRPGWALVEANALSEADWVERIASHFGLAAVQIADFTIDRALTAKVPEELARRHQLLPLCNTGGEVYLAISDPTELSAFDHVRRLLGAPVLTVVVAPSALASAHEKIYLRDQAVDFEHVGADNLGDLSAAELARLKEEGESGKAVQLVDRLLAHGISVGASDIHIETGAQHLRVRFRVDGVLREGPRYPAALSPMVVSRVKVMAQLDISERWVPQDGRVRLRRQGADLDLRISCIPVARGEKVVIRLLSAGRERSTLEDLGLDRELVPRLLAEAHRPHGMLLVTGPTGSGKTSTLYAMLRACATSEINAVTVEDPIEYELESLNQIPINPKRGVTFPTALRAILRQDPDVILVGEIRDQETGLIAAEAALTGHLVLSTLHTNDAASSVLRLCEMGVPRFLVAAVVNTIVAQRLIRKICSGCAFDYQPTEDELRTLGPGFAALAHEPGLRFARGRGCPRCDGSGYKGRIPIIELLIVDGPMREAIVGGVGASQLHAMAVAGGMAELRTAGLKRLFARETTTSEVIRVCASGGHG